MLWIICCGQHVHIPWVTWVMLWVYAVGTLSSAIWCGLPYAVDDSRPHHIQPVVHSIYMVWGYAVGTHELCRCDPLYVKFFVLIIIIFDFFYVKYTYLYVLSIF